MSEQRAIQIGGVVPGATGSALPTVTAKTITANISACLGGAGPFAIIGRGTPNTTQVFRVIQTVPDVLGFSNAETGPFGDTIDITVSLDGSGAGQSAPFYMKAVGLGQTVVSICNDQQTCPWNQLSALVVNVASVEWEVLDSPLDTNPNAGGGLRIFPEKLTPEDTTDRTLIGVKVTLSAEHSRMIGVKAMDVDDPSSDVAPIDPTGDSGNDNRGTTPHLGANGEATANLTTGPDGVARILFQVSKQPGDNFRVAGACHLPDRDGLAVDGDGIREASGQPLPTELAKMTPLLTAWRRLHIEVDSMGEVQGNFVEGTVTKERFSQKKGTTVLTLLDKLDDYGRFAPGRVTIDTIGAFPVVGARGGSLTVEGRLPQDPAGLRFTLVDDDDFNDDDGEELDGDIGEDLPEPDLSWIQDSDLPEENVLAPAYVRPTYDLDNSRPEAPFVLNSDISYEYFDHLDRVTDNNFWTAYLLGAYQYLTQDDRDGEGTATFGLGSIWGANIYLEVGRPWEERRYADKASFVNQAATTAHEVGHWFGADDDDRRSDPEGGLMCWPPDRRKGTFSDQTLAVIRSKVVQ